MKYEPKEISSVGTLLAILQEQVDRANDTVWFRGHPVSTWKLLPTLYRDNYTIVHESTLQSRFMQNALPLLHFRPANDWEWLFLMRHHGCPTRLLDWTESPLVALFFACEDEKHREVDGDLWCLLPTVLNENWGMTGEHSGEIPAFGRSAEIDQYSPGNIIMSRGIESYPAAAIAPRESGRMSVQQSVFTIHHKRIVPIEDIGEKNHLWKLTIPKDAKQLILNELATLGISRLAIYPDLDSVAQLAKDALHD